MASISKNSILIINAHPDKQSFCSSLAFAYFKGVDKSTDNRTLINLVDLDLDFKISPKNIKELKPDVVFVQKMLKNATHIVFVFPNWWGTYPAILKGFIDHIFIPDFAYKYQNNSQLPIPLLKGKSARLIMTMDTPVWYYSLYYKSPGLNSLKKSILNFCGIKPVKTTIFTSVKKSTEKKRKDWLKKIEEMGRKNQ